MKSLDGLFGLNTVFKRETLEGHIYSRKVSNLTYLFFYAGVHGVYFLQRKFAIFHAL